VAPRLRRAGEADAPVLVRLIEEASHGIALYAWTRIAEAVGPLADPWEIGRSRQAERARRGEWIVLDDGGVVVAGLLAVPPASEPPGPDLPALFRPLAELEALAPDALYINAVAVLPEARGRGLGTRLMRHAEVLAREAGRPRTSLIVNDDNAGARQLYQRLGYRDIAARPMVKEGWQGSGTAWLLMTREPG
jgi:GNAT superfamily N-acetyltransferase